MQVVQDMLQIVYLGGTVHALCLERGRERREREREGGGG